MSASPHRRRRTRISVSLAAAAVALASLLATPVLASAQASPSWPTLEELGLEAPDDRQWDRSVIRYQAEGTVRSVESVFEDGEDVVIELSADILFAFDSAELPPTAGERLAEILADVPEGTAIAVHGHTDSVGTDEYNLDLSTRRAEAVAASIEAARPDLGLDVEGFGETRPKVEEAGDDVAEDRAANRRVELRYRP